MTRAPYPALIHLIEALSHAEPHGVERRKTTRARPRNWLLPDSSFRADWPTVTRPGRGLPFRLILDRHPPGPVEARQGETSGAVADRRDHGPPRADRCLGR